MANSIQLPDNPEIANKILDNQKEKDQKHTEIGWLGRAWGVSSSVPNNLAALTIVAMLIIGCILSCKKTSLDDVTTIWSIFNPLITLALGYLFGYKQANSRNNSE